MADSKKSMSTGAKVAIVFGALVVVLFLVGMSIYSTAVHSVYNPYKIKTQAADAAWAEVINQYQRRADLIPNLTAIVSQAAGHENSTLKAVTEARAKANSVQLTADALNDPNAMKRFSQVQGDLTTALSKLMMLTETYPTLKVNENFLNVQAQLEGTENRITVARTRYIRAVTDVNSVIATFPNNIYAGALQLKERAQFSVENEREISTAPKIQQYNERAK